MIEAAKKTFSFGDFELSGAKRLLMKRGEAVALNSKTFDLLLTLVENRGQILSKNELLDKVWEGQFVEENNLTVQISALRKIFGEKKNEHKFIATIPGRGYKFVADVSLLSESSEQEKPNNLSVVRNALTVSARPRFETTLIGRGREIADIKDLLGQNDVNLVTLTGAGGSGKTSLARSIAEELRLDFADGVFFVELAAATETDFVVSAIAQTLDISEASNKSLVETIRDFLGTRKILLILDNFEQVLSAAPIAGDFSAASASLKILVTSRAALHLPNEREFVVLPLALPPLDSRFSNDNLDEYPAIALFCKRAQAVKPNFVLTNENIASVAEICRRLDGLPLAIELAAVRVKLLSPNAILERLENSLNLLTGGAKDLPSRQRTMRGAVEWSYNLLTDDEKILFRRLSVFAGGFTVEAVEFVVEEEKRRGGEEEEKRRRGEEEKRQSGGKAVSDENLLVSSSPPSLFPLSVLDLLDSLIENNLLVSKDQTDGNARLRMLEVVREFALECLEKSGESENVQRSHALYFLDLTEKAEPHLSGESSVEWMEKLEAEHDNIRAALRWALKTDAEILTRIVGAFRYFWLEHGYLSEGSEWFKSAFEQCRETDSPIRFKLLNGIGLFMRYRGNYEEAQKYYEKCRIGSEKAGETKQLVAALQGLAIVALTKEDFTAAQKYSEETLTLSRQTNNDLGTATALALLGNIAIVRGDFSAARQLFNESQVIAEKLGSNYLTCLYHLNFGIIEFQEKNFFDARRHFSDSLKMATDAGDKPMISVIIDGFAALAEVSGDSKCAVRLAGAAEGLRESIGYSLEPAEEIFRNEYLAETRAALSEKQFAELYANGLTMKSNEAVALALNQNLLENIEFETKENDYSNEIIIENHKFKRISFEESEPETKHLPAEQNGSRRLLIFALSALAVAVIGAGFWLWTKNQTTAAPIESIAVMPFIYEGGNSDTEYLSDGMTESLINNLSQIPNLTVKARASVFYYKGKEIAPQKVGDELNVQAVLLGRIAERGENLNISLELVDAKTNNHLWGEQYTRKKSDLAVLQNDIARDVSAKLRRKLANDDTLQKGQTANAEAYQLYLKGRFLWNKRKHEEHLKALAAFEQAIALDPNFALAYAAIGDVYTLDSFRGTDEEKDPKGRAAALKALEIEPNLAEALTVLANIELNSFKREESEKYFKRAIELNPNYASARQWYGGFLIEEARFEESIREINRALELDPLSPVINSDAAYIYLFARQYDRAVAQANKLLELDASWVRAYEWRGWAYEKKGDYAAALTDFEKAGELSNRPEEKKAKDREDFRQIRQAFEKSGEQGYWRKYLEVVRSYPPEYAHYYFEAICHLKLGDKENALASLEKALERKGAMINLMKVEPFFDSLQSEPRFQTLLRRMGLTP